MPHLVLALATLLLSALVQASESDAFTFRYDNLADATDSINRETNRLIQQGIQNANQGGCDADALRDELHDALTANGKGKLKPFLNSKGPIQRRRGEWDVSMYRYVSRRDSPFFTAVRGMSGVMGAIFRMGDYQIGSDKFSHFFNQGRRYYQKHFEERASALEVAYANFKSETSSYLGAPTTGVMSYSDLSANFAGMRFWNEVVGEQVDPVTGVRPARPYVSCKAGAWVQIRALDWREYVDASWDEAYNCANFRSERMVKAVGKRLAEYQTRTGRVHACPLAQGRLEATVAKMGKFAPLLVNGKGHETVDQAKTRLAAIRGHLGEE